MLLVGSGLLPGFPAFGLGSWVSVLVAPFLGGRGAPASLGLPVLGVGPGWLRLPGGSGFGRVGCCPWGAGFAGFLGASWLGRCGGSRGSGVLASLVAPSRGAGLCRRRPGILACAPSAPQHAGFLLLLPGVSLGGSRSRSAGLGCRPGASPSCPPSPFVLFSLAASPPRFLCLSSFPALSVLLPRPLSVVLSRMRAVLRARMASFAGLGSPGTVLAPVSSCFAFFLSSSTSVRQPPLGRLLHFGLPTFSRWLSSFSWRFLAWCCFGGLV